MLSAAWELLDAARDSDIDKCALARSLLAASKRLAAGFFLANRFDLTTRSKRLGEATEDVSSSEQTTDGCRDAESFNRDSFVDFRSHS